ncbi:50S ribosomal protein L11 methyltransferase [Casaltella massiliensis]|nr:50S ribosomal protein L11 methyltransferase [Casaltella massiliensis]
MKYIQVEIKLDQVHIEPVTGLLLTMGIDETAVEDPSDLAEILSKEHGYEWDYIDDGVLASSGAVPKITFYLDEGEDERAASLARKIGAEFTETEITITAQDDSQWKDKWKEFFKPAHITEDLVVKPTWEEYRPKGREKVIEIDPGMAFGTGTHETTSLCLKLMEKYLRPKDHVLDVGCGSGILSVGAALLGAEKVLAIDIDPEAVKVSAENVKLNRCTDTVEVRQGNLIDGVDFMADITVANLMADLVMLLTGHMYKAMNQGGIYISSGILTEKEDEVTRVIKSCGFDIIETRKDGMWCAIAARARF